MRNKDFELLAPAGNINIFKAVIEAGADAVYVGGDMFGARAYAGNFNEEELLEAIDYAHLRGVKVYLTVNTLLKNDEIGKLYDYLLPYYKRGLDAVLVQDFGALYAINNWFPDLPIHTSTQMTITGIEGVKFLQQYNVTRVVMAREVTIEEMKTIHSETGMELEAFIHGALCYSYSGQCLFSSLLGGRSGNRGRCAQPCRLPYKVGSDKETYILSMKDMCGIEHLRELKEAGVYSLKIEGRMKQIGYATGVVAQYRKYIDSMKTVSDKDLKKIKELGNRCDFTNDYYFKHNDSNMITYEKPNFVSNAIEDYEIPNKLEIYGFLKLKINEPAQLIVNYKDFSFTCDGDAVQIAKNAPLTEEDAIRRINKTGDTPFLFADIICDIDDNVFVPNGSINKLRREALQGLLNDIVSDNFRNKCENKELNKFSLNDLNQNKIIACVMNNAQLNKVLEYELFTDIFVDFNRYDKNNFIEELKQDVLITNQSGKNYYLALPYIFRKNTNEFFDKYISEINNIGIKGFVIRNTEELQWTRTYFKNAEIIIDHNQYTYNDLAKKMYFDNGVTFDTVPFELNFSEINKRNNINSICIVYGYYPIMTSAQCVHKNSVGCDKTKQITYLKDRYNKSFPVINNCNECYNTIYNSLPTVLFKNMSKLKNCGISSFRFDFTIESPKQIEIVVNSFVTDDYIVLPEYTNGHFKRGVE